MIERLPPLPPGANTYGSGGANLPPQNVMDDIYELILSLYSTQNDGQSGLNIAVIAQQVTQLIADLTAEGSQDASTQALLAGLNAKIYDGGTQSFASLCATISNSATSAEDRDSAIAQIQNQNTNFMHDFSLALTSSSPPNSQYFTMPNNQSWRTAENVQGDTMYQKSTDAANLLLVYNDVSALTNAIRTGNIAAIIAAIKKLDTDLGNVNPPDAFTKSLLSYLTTKIPSSGSPDVSLLDLANAGNTQGIQDALQANSGALADDLTDILNNYMSWEGP